MMFPAFPNHPSHSVVREHTNQRRNEELGALECSLSLANYLIPADRSIGIIFMSLAWRPACGKNLCWPIWSQQYRQSHRLAIQRASNASQSRSSTSHRQIQSAGHAWTEAAMTAKQYGRWCTRTEPARLLFIQQLLWALHRALINR